MASIKTAISLLLVLLLASASSADNALGVVSETQPMATVRLFDNPPVVTHLLTERPLVSGDILAVIRGSKYKGDAEVLSVSEGFAKIRCLDDGMSLEEGDLVRFLRAGRASIEPGTCWCGSPLYINGGCWSTMGPPRD